MKKLKAFKNPRTLMIGSLPPPVHGSAMMMQYIKDSKLINEQFECDYINISTSRKMDEIGKRPFLKVLRAIGIYITTLWHFICHKYDLCYMAVTCHDGGFLKDMPVMVLARIFCKKRVIHQHNKGMSGCIDRWPYYWLIPFCYKGAKVILLSWRLYPDIEKVVKKEDVMICPNGIPSTLANEPTSERHNSVPHILYLSNLIPEKGVYVLLDALKILKDTGYSFICDFVGGETKDLDALRFNQEVAKRNLKEMAVYHGRKYGNEKEAFWENADIFVFPTFYDNETFGLVNIEAMQHKIPVITTNVGGIPDVVDDGKTGYICLQSNEKSLSEKLIMLLDNPNLRVKMGENGYQKYRQMFTLVNFEECLINCLKI